MPNLRLVSEEYGTTCIEFFAFFGFLPQGEGLMGKVPSQNTEGIVVDPNVAGGRYQLVSLTFEDVGWLQRSPQHSDSEVIDEAEFDWSAVSGKPTEAEGPGQWQKRVLAEWVRTSIAPDPSIYVVENSVWKSKEAMKWGLTHYLILGEYCYFEILSKKMEWKSKGSVIGW